MNYYYTNNYIDAFGPYSHDELRQYFNTGSLSQETLVCAEGTDEWQPIIALFSVPEKKVPSTLPEQLHRSLPAINSLKQNSSSIPNNIPVPPASDRSSKANYNNDTSFNLKTLGITLIILFAAFFLTALMQTKETESERLNREVISSSEEGLDYVNNAQSALDSLDRLSGRPSDRRKFARSEMDFQNSLVKATRAADGYKSERTQRMFTFLFVSAVCLIAGIACFIISKKTILQM